MFVVRMAGSLFGSLRKSNTSRRGKSFALQLLNCKSLIKDGLLFWFWGVYVCFLINSDGERGRDESETARLRCSQSQQTRSRFSVLKSLFRNDFT